MKSKKSNLIKVSIFLCLITLFMTNCDNDEIMHETSINNQFIESERIPFNNTQHFSRLEDKIDKFNIKLETLKTQKDNNASAVEILTEDVLYTSYANTHTYTFILVRDNPVYWLENVVLHYNTETDNYNEYLIQYTFDENLLLDISNDEEFENSEYVNIINLEEGFFNQNQKSGCTWTSETVWQNCSEDQHGEWNFGEWGDCRANIRPSVYQQWSMNCESIDAGPSVGGGTTPDGNGNSGGGGGNSNVVSNPLTNPPCPISSGNFGIVNSSGGCVKPRIEDDDCTNNYYNDLSSNSPFNLDTSELCDRIHPLPQGNSLEARRLRCVYEKLTESPKFKTLFENTFDQSENINIKFEIVDFNPASNGNVASGRTDMGDPPSIRHQTIQMDRGHLLSDHPLSTAQTIIHEALHAFINVKVAQCIDDPTTTTTFNDINELNQLTFDELLNDFAIDCDVANLLDHRLMYNRMVDVMNEMLNEVFNDLVATEDLNPPYWMADGTQFNWNDAMHYLNLSGLQEANEYIEDNVANPNIEQLVIDYTNKINDDSFGFNHETCN